MLKNCLMSLTEEKLTGYCLIRWIARIDKLVIFETFLTLIVYALEK